MGVGLSACGADPAPASAYAGEALRVVDEGCDRSSLRDGEDRACVFVEVMAEGEGAEVAKGEWVRVHYVVEAVKPGKSSGKVLDSSHDGKALYFKAGESNDVIDGMHRGVMGMKVGERRRFLVPPKLGYRGRKMPGMDGEDNLLFMVERVP